MPHQDEYPAIDDLTDLLIEHGPAAMATPLAASRADRPAFGPRLDIELDFRLDQAVHEPDLLGELSRKASPSRDRHFTLNL